MGDEASGGGFDPCSCVCISDHAMAMRRLLNVLRNSQTVCTDTECFEPGLPDRPSETPAELYLVTIVFGIALIMFYFRSLSGRVTGIFNKKIRDGDDFDRAPPAPPID